MYTKQPYNSASISAVTLAIFCFIDNSLDVLRNHGNPSFGRLTTNIRIKDYRHSQLVISLSFRASLIMHKSRCSLLRAILSIYSIYSSIHVYLQIFVSSTQQTIHLYTFIGRTCQSSFVFEVQSYRNSLNETFVDIDHFIFNKYKALIECAAALCYCFVSLFHFPFQNGSLHSSRC